MHTFPRATPVPGGTPLSCQLPEQGCPRDRQVWATKANICLEIRNEIGGELSIAKLLRRKRSEADP